jgi:hypothetical protein
MDLSNLMSQIHKVNEDVLRNSFERTSDILASQSREGHAQESRDHRQTQYVIDAIHNVGDNNLAATERNGANISVQNERLTNELVTMLGAHHSAVLERLHHSEVHSTRDFGSLQLQAAQNTCKLEVGIKDATNKLELQAANNFAAVQLEAMRNKTDLMQKISDCCCEVKERVAASDASIKELVKSVETERIRNALQSAETKNLILEMSRGGGHGGNGQGN